MKKIKEKKDKFYIANQPKHTTLAILSVDTDFPIEEEVHESIERLEKIADIMFVFDDHTFKNTLMISKKKFACLYESSSWADSETYYLETMLRSVDYATDVFLVHNSFLIGNLSDLGNWTEENINSFEKTLSSGIRQPVLNIHRLSSEDFLDTYSISTVIPSLPWKQLKEDENKYASYTSSSRLMFFKKPVLEQIRIFTETEIGLEYLQSFKKDDCRYFFASVIKRLGLDYLDKNIEDVNV